MNLEPAATAPAGGTPSEPASISANDQVAALLARCTFASPGTAVQCALSGGPDSSALLALAVAAGLDVTAVHVDHGLRPESSHDAEIAATVAQRFDVAFRCERITVDDGPNLEARARLARRRAIGPGALTGHTADDQAETLLLSMLRGAGTAGLSAMRPGHSKPILAIRRADTLRLCSALQLDVATDSTNTDRRFTRNRVRHEVLPILSDVAQRDVVPLLTRASDLLRSDGALLDELAAVIDPTDARAVADAPVPLARRALRHWLIDTVNAASDGMSERHPPDLATVDRILDVARGAAIGCDVTGGWRVERSQQRLRLFPTQAASS